MKARVYKTIRNVAGKLRQDLGSGARLLVFVVDTFSGEMVPCWPLTDIPVLAKPSLELVKVCLKRERSVLISGKEDPLLQTLIEVDFQCALCVPLADSDRNVVGVIYIDHQQTGALSNALRLQIERLARDLSGSLPRLGAPSPGPTAGPEPPPNWASKTAVALVGLLGVFLVFWLLAPADRPVPPPAEAVQKATRWKSDPSAVVHSFHQLLASRELAQAWELLHPDLQASLPRETFQEQAVLWFTDESNRWEFARRSVRKGESTPEDAQIYLDPAAELPDLETWQWHLKLSNGQWKIHDVQGGPVGNAASSFER
jgi:hypothetical protein